MSAGKLAIPNAERIKLFSGNAHRALADAIAQHLDIPLGQADVSQFADGEINVEIGESVRGMDTYLIQPTCPEVNKNLMELLVMMDAVKRASAKRITAVIPYYGYARQDRKVSPRAPITAKLVANLITAAGADRVITVDLHAGQIQGFFDVPVDNLYAARELAHAFENCIQCDISDIVVVSPDAGGVRRARYFSRLLGRESGLAIIDKRRSGPGQVAKMNIVGDVKGKTAVIIDDMVDSAGTLAKAANKLEEEGAACVYACVVHPVLSDPAVERINDSAIREIIVSDTIPLREDAAKSKKFKVATVSHLLAEGIWNIVMGGSISSLFPDIEVIN